LEEPAYTKLSSIKRYGYPTDLCQFHKISARLLTHTHALKHT